MNRLIRHTFLILAALPCLRAEESPTAIEALPTTIRVQLASAAGGEPLTSTSVVTEEGRKTYIARYRNRSTGEMQTVRVDENGTVQADEPRRSPATAGDSRRQEVPSVIQTPAVGTTSSSASGPTTSAGPAPVVPPSPVEPPKKAGKDEPAEPKPVPAHGSDEPRAERDRSPERVKQGKMEEQEKKEGKEQKAKSAETPAASGEAPASGGKAKSGGSGGK